MENVYSITGLPRDCAPAVSFSPPFSLMDQVSSVGHMYPASMKPLEMTMAEILEAEQDLKEQQKVIEERLAELEKRKHNISSAKDIEAN